MGGRCPRPVSRPGASGNRKFESISLQRGVQCEPEFLDQGTENYPSRRRSKAVTAVYVFWCIPFGLTALLMFRFVNLGKSESFHGLALVKSMTWRISALPGSVAGENNSLPQRIGGGTKRGLIRSR
jgi:hypothetical protein